MTSLRFLSLILTCLFLGAPGLAMAQGFEIVKVALDRKEIPVMNDPGFVRNAVTDAYNQHRSKIQDALRGKLGQGNLIARGITLYNINVQFGRLEFKTLSTNQVEVWLRGNHFYAKSTTPTDLGKWADPAFEVNFDARFVMHFTLPTVQRPQVDVGVATVEIPSLTFNARNVVGKVATTAAVAGNFFLKLTTGRDLIREKLTPFLTFDVTNLIKMRLNRVNQTLANVAREGFTVPTVTKVNDQLTRILMQKPKPIKSSGKPRPKTATLTPAQAQAAAMEVARVQKLQHEALLRSLNMLPGGK